MSRVLVLSRRVVLAGLVAATALLGGCVTYPDSYYYQDRYADDAYNGDYYYSRDYDRGYYSGYGYYGYSSVLWPAYYNYYDPWHRSGFYYGVTYFPRDWYGYSFGFHNYDPWPYYHHYSPYRHSWSDNNHGWYGGAGWRHGNHDADSGARFGSARNEAERLAHITGADRSARAYRNDRGGAGYGDDVSLGTTTRGAGVPMGRDAMPRGAEPQRGNYSRDIDYGSRGRDAGYEGRQYQSSRRPDSAAPQGDAGPRYQSLRQVGPAYKPGQQAPVSQGRYENYSRDSDAGGGFQAQPQRSIEPPRPQYQAPAPRDTGSFTRSDSGSRDAGPSRSDSGGWSRDRDDGGERED